MTSHDYDRLDPPPLPHTGPLVQPGASGALSTRMESAYRAAQQVADLEAAVEQLRQDRDTWKAQADSLTRSLEQTEHVLHTTVQERDSLLRRLVSREANLRLISHMLIDLMRDAQPTEDPKADEERYAQLLADAHARQQGRNLDGSPRREAEAEAHEGGMP